MGTTAGDGLVTDLAGSERIHSHTLPRRTSFTARVLPSPVVHRLCVVAYL